MFCILYKWIISRSMDTDKPLPRRVVRHMDRCGACKVFQSRCLAVADRLSEQAGLQTCEVSPELHTKILSGLGSQSQCNTAGTLAELNVRRLWPRLAPVLASAVVLLALVGLHYYSASPSSGPNFTQPSLETQSNIAEPIAWLLFPEELNVEPAPLIEGVLQWPIRQEIRLLKQDGKAMAEFLLACIPLEMDALLESDSS